MQIEINIDGLVGPTHHFGGLGVGNLASLHNARRVSRPREAAIEGLKKAWLVGSWGVPQFVLPPPNRPRLDFLQHVGFGGSVAEQLKAARECEPRLLSTAFSSAFMWMANAATVCPACDSVDRIGHMTPANLISSWHRSFEAHERGMQLKKLFDGVDSIAIHDPLPPILPLRDEGAANHMRLCDRSGSMGLHVFVYGVDTEKPSENADTLPARFYPRHTRQASLAQSRLHRLDGNRTIFVKQHPQAIDGGVFHNDVIATSCDHLLVYHELAFDDTDRVVDEIANAFTAQCNQSLLRVPVSSSDLSLQDAVKSYLFNSQIIRTNRLSEDAPRMVIVCPQHCADVPAARQLLERWVLDRDNPIEEVQFVKLEQSMANGGGPACLRLRMVVSAEQLSQMNSRYRLDDRLFDRLSTIFEMYPEQLQPIEDFTPDLVEQLVEIERAFSSLFD